jgi:hypothetical protein
MAELPLVERGVAIRELEFSQQRDVGIGCQVILANLG